MVYAFNIHKNRKACFKFLIFGVVVLHQQCKGLSPAKLTVFMNYVLDMGTTAVERKKELR